MIFSTKPVIDGVCTVCNSGLGEQVFHITVQLYVPILDKVSSHGAEKVFDLCSKCYGRTYKTLGESVAFSLFEDK